MPGTYEFMNTMSISVKNLNDLFADHGLDAPAVLPWPLSPEAETDRRLREAAFANGLGSHPPPGLEWIRSHSESKYRPDRIVEGCRAVLVTALGYYRSDDIDTGGPTASEGRIARYARGRDYHKELGNRLRKIARELQTAAPDHQFRPFTDIGPLDETWLAEASGLGFKGRHTLAILPTLGSWAVLGHIITTHPFPASPGRPSPLSCPQGCTRCIDACPSSALLAPGRLEPSLCISYHTIEHKGPLHNLPAGAGNRVFGCDACQEACPFNARVMETGVEGFRRDIAGASRDLKDMLSLENRDEVLKEYAGSPLMRAGRESLVRNACIAAGNSGDLALIPYLEKLLNDGDEGVRTHAHRALAKLTGKPGEYDS